MIIRRMLHSVSAVIVLLLLSIATKPARAALGGVLAIDYGTEWTKVSLIRAGVPFDVLLNTDSKRKIQSSVALRGDERWIGGDAASLASRYPESSFSGVKLLLGHSSTDPQSVQYESIYRTTVFTNQTSAKASLVDPSSSAHSSQPVSPEEILALQFNHAKKLAKDAAGGETIRDTVVTVPSFFRQSERQAVLDALEIAGLKPIALLDDGSAVAINYAMTRAFPADEEEFHLFYDAGAGSIRATVVSFQTSEVREPAGAKTAKNVTLAAIQGVGYDKSVGGALMDAKIRDMLEQQFLDQIAKQGTKLETTFSENRRAHAKLLKEASRVKQVLSANAEAPSRVEGLAEDIDFRGLVTREAFEAACEPFVAAFTQPIHDALKVAELSLDDITSVVLVGGASRVPMISNAVKALVGEQKLAQNLNADEAAVMGAALYGATKSSQFRTKDIRLTPMILHKIERAFEAGNVEAHHTNGSLITQGLFSPPQPAGVRKNLTFAKKHDFPVRFQYSTRRSVISAEPENNIFVVNITGVTDHFANLTESEAANTTAVVEVELNESNMLEIVSARLALPEAPKLPASVKDKIKGFFAGSSSGNDETATSGSDGSNGTDAKADSSSSSSSNSDDNASAPAAGSIPLQVGIGHLGPAPLASAEKKEASKRLRELDQAEARKRNREEARNSLEAYIYRMRDTLEQDSFVEASTEAERVKLRKQLEEASEWLWDAGESAPTKDLRAAKTELERAAAGPNNRLTEAAGRTAAATEFRIGMIQAQAFLISATKQLENDTAAEQPSKYTETELKTLEGSISSNEKWLSEMEKKQASLKANEDPVLKIAELEKRTRELSAQVTVLKLKRAPRKPKPTSSTTTAAATDSSSSSATVTSSARENEQSLSAPPSSSETARPRDEL